MTSVGKVPQQTTLCKRCRQMKPSSLFRWLDDKGQLYCGEDCRDRAELICKIQPKRQLPIPREASE